MLCCFTWFPCVSDQQSLAAGEQVPSEISVVSNQTRMFNSRLRQRCSISTDIR